MPTPVTEAFPRPSVVDERSADGRGDATPAGPGDAVQRGSCLPLVLGREVVDIDTGETFVAVGITVDAEGLLAAVST
jgi:hypothetical protein